MWDDIIEYCSKLYCEAIAKYAIPPLLYSGICSKFVHYEDVNEFRYRLNIMLHWDFGYFKSALLKKVVNWLPLKGNILSTASSAALRGSFVQGRFYPPELLISELLVITEFQSIIKADDAMLGQLLIALEEGEMRVALVKAGKVNDSEKSRIRGYGAQYEDGRLSYQNLASVWTATHTVDNIPDHSRQAILSRFFTCRVFKKQFPAKMSHKEYTKFIDSDFEDEIVEWLYNIKHQQGEPDHKFSQKVIEYMDNHGFLPMMSPREIGDLRRMIIAHREAFHKDSVDTVANAMKPFLEQKGILTTSELIAQTIYENPTTIKSLEELTGKTKSTIFGHIKRLGAQKDTKMFPCGYYLGSNGKKPKKDNSFSKQLTKQFSKKGKDK